MGVLLRFLTAAGVFNCSRKFTGSSFLYLVECPMSVHKACRNGPYVLPSGQHVRRFPVPDDKVLWSVPWASYDPLNFTVKGLSKQPWADPDLESEGFYPKFNRQDGRVDRNSHMGLYDASFGCPLNPCGRTGLRGRGRLGRWGPNHAVDSIVTRWKRDPDDGSQVVDARSKLPVLQFIAIQRRDTGEWALPGGMIDPGEFPETAVRREFFEEALNIPNPAEFFETEAGKKLKDFFDKGLEIYKGYVDDPRNTDNAWMETTAFHFHDVDGSIVSLMKIEGGDDAVKAEWVDISSELKLYASHSKIVYLVVSALEAHW